MKHLDRTAKWVVGGLALAVAMSGLGVASAGTSGPAPAFTAITPCRLMDTRPEFNVGPRATPLGENTVVDVQVHGANGRCSIPSSATAITANVTTVGPTAASFLSIWPAGEANPGTSSLNYFAGQPPTPNTISVALSPSGAISLLNRFGSVDVVIDIAGYYADHTHDDRYYTKGQVDTRLGQKADAADVYTKSEIDAASEELEAAIDQKADAADVYTKAEVYRKDEIDLLLPSTYLVTSSFTCSTGAGTCASGAYTVEATCTAGDEVTGGSAIQSSAGIDAAHPASPIGTPPDAGTGWRASNLVALADGTSITVVAVCATIPTS